MKGQLNLGSYHNSIAHGGLLLLGIDRKSGQVEQASSRVSGGYGLMQAPSACMAKCKWMGVNMLRKGVRG